MEHYFEYTARAILKYAKLFPVWIYSILNSTPYSWFLRCIYIGKWYIASYGITKVRGKILKLLSSTLPKHVFRPTEILIGYMQIVSPSRESLSWYIGTRVYIIKAFVQSVLQNHAEFELDEMALWQDKACRIARGWSFELIGFISLR
jgi:hypothetical protein